MAMEETTARCSLSQRDNTLDTLRGFVMMYVIFIHCIYWIDIFNGKYSSIIKSLFLIEMPLFFFIAGASNSMGKHRGILAFYFSRFQRILLPYWICAVIYITLTITAQKIISFEQEKYFSIGLPLLFTPVSKLPYMTGGLWFIPVYLYVILAFPFLKWYYFRHEHDNKKYMPLMVFVILLCNNGWEIVYEAKMVFFYCFWIYLGLFYKRINWYETAKNKIKIVPVIVFCALLVLWFIQKNVGYANMQINKFPPNIVFFVYTFGTLLTLYIFSKHILFGITFLRKNKVFDWIYKQYIQNCYTIFLYHPLSFLTIFIILKYSGLKDYLFRNDWICFIVYMILTISMNAVIGKIFSWGERIGIKKW
jgi:fucose 4-O-acetylase-like acetyltransferase